MTAANHLLVAMAESTNSRQRIEALYRSALELNAIDRQAFLDRVCADDESLRQDARPVSTPCQNGEFAERATKCERCCTNAFITPIAISPSGIPIWTCSPKTTR